MPESANYFQNAQFAGCFKNDLKKPLTLDALGAGFFSVDGSRLGKDFRRHNFCSRLGCGTRFHGGRSGNVGVAEAGLANLASRRRGMRVAGGNAVAESRARNYAPSAVGAACPVAIA